MWEWLKCLKLSAHPYTYMCYRLVCCSHLGCNVIDRWDYTFTVILNPIKWLLFCTIALGRRQSGLPLLRSSTLEPTVISRLFNFISHVEMRNYILIPVPTSLKLTLFNLSTWTV